MRLELSLGLFVLILAFAILIATLVIVRKVQNAKVSSAYRGLQSKKAEFVDNHRYEEYLSHEIREAEFARVQRLEEDLRKLSRALIGKTMVEKAKAGLALAGEIKGFL